MPRPFCSRIVRGNPVATYFKPVRIPMRFLAESNLSLDEFEAIRLADYEGLYQEDAAKEMGISRPTFARIIESARKKIADSIVNGKALKIETKESSRICMNQINSGACQRRYRHMGKK